MSTFSRSTIAAIALLLALAAAPVAAEENLAIDFPSESPVSVVSMDWGSSDATPRGGALVVDLHTSLKLRNASQNRIRGITLLVLAQEVTPGGKASVSVPSLNVGPGEVFPVRIDLRLLRPLQRGTGPLVKVDLDGVLFDDWTFFGPNRLNSRRSMIVWEQQARRDRSYWKRVLEARGAEGLREEALMSLARQADRHRVNVEVASSGRATNVDAGRRYDLTFLHFPGAPVQALSGSARLSGREARAPSMEVRNLSARSVRHLEVGWIFKASNGEEFVAGSVPSELRLAPGGRTRIESDRVLRFSRELAVDSMSGFVSQVEFDNGEVWIPSREELAGHDLERLTAPSPEEQRLANLYRKKGLDALIAELENF